MKKLVVLIFSIFLFVNTSFADLLPFSEEENSLEIVSIQTGSLTDEQLKIVNASYIYYYGQGCSHCATVDNYLKKTDAYNKLDMVKKEVWYDKDNAGEMVEALKRLGLNTNTGVPFILVRDIDGGESYLSGDTPIIDHFKPYLGEANQNTSINSDTDNNHNGTIVLVVLVIIAVGASFFFIKINK